MQLGSMESMLREGSFIGEGRGLLEAGCMGWRWVFAWMVNKMALDGCNIGHEVVILHLRSLPERQLGRALLRLVS